MSWDLTRVKAQFRFAAQRLGQQQDKLHSQSPIIKRDIATLLQQGNLVLARAKAQNVIKDEIKSDLFQVLEMYLGVILEHFGELEKSENPSPRFVEAAASITFAALQVDVKELHACRDVLIRQLGQDFARAATGNHDQYVSLRVIRALSAPPPSAARLDDYLLRIATAHGVQWMPDVRPHEKLTALSEILDSEASPFVDLPKLQKLCAYGLPHQPSWLRPRIWRILFGLLPVVKSSWGDDARKQRDSYYDLVRRLLKPFIDAPPPCTPLSSVDRTLVDVATQLSHVPPNLYSQLEQELEPHVSCPFNEEAAEDIRIPYADSLDARLKTLKNQGSKDFGSDFTPEIRLESDENNTPEMSVVVSSPLASRRSSAPTTLHLSRSYGAGGAHGKHMSALLRLLYIHSCLNPANHSPHMASILVPLYSVLNTEIELDDLAHAEADTFWLFEAIVGECSELEDEGGNLWMRKFGERLSWADPDLSADLAAKGLDPGLPHYSYRWMAPLLTHTLPLSSVWMTWDVLFSRPMRSRDSNPKLDILLDICTSMLIRARAPLFRLGKPGRRSPGLWTEENTWLPPPSPLRPWELSDAFLEGMSLLQLYPIEAAGGIDRVLQTAGDLTMRRETQLKAPHVDNASLGARLRETVWKGFTNQVSSTPSSPTSSVLDEENESTTESDSPHDEGDIEASGFTSRLANTVWRGIMNQGASVSSNSPGPTAPRYLVPPSPELRAQSLSPIPPSPLSLTRSFTPEPAAESANIWNYAEKLRYSDTAAKLSKASTNWRVKALEAWINRPSIITNTKSAPTSPPQSHAGKLSGRNSVTFNDNASAQYDMLGTDTSYSPLVRPAFFRNPRDTLYLDTHSTPTSPDLSPRSEARSVASGVSSISRLKHGGPKPLLLNTSSLMSSSTPSVEKTVPATMHRDSVSSTSSAEHWTSPYRTPSRDGNSDTMKSRIVPLRRSAVSSVATSSILGYSRPASSSSAASSEKGYSPGMSDPVPKDQITIRDLNGSKSERRPPSPDSPATLPSSPPPKTPISSIIQTVHVSTAERQGRFSVSNEASDIANDSLIVVAQPFIRKKTPCPVPDSHGMTSDSSAGFPVRSKLKRQPPRLRGENSTSTIIVGQQQSPSPNSLALPEWPHEVEGISTPTASEFGVIFPSHKRLPKVTSEGNVEVRTRKLSGEAREVRTRKTSDVRIRKISSESRSSRRNRDSSAVEGDDEGYDDLLSAYESDEGERSYVSGSVIHS